MAKHYLGTMTTAALAATLLLAGCAPSPDGCREVAKALQFASGLSDIPSDLGPCDITTTDTGREVTSLLREARAALDAGDPDTAKVLVSRGWAAIITASTDVSTARVDLAARFDQSLAGVMTSARFEDHERSMRAFIAYQLSKSRTLDDVFLFLSVAAAFINVEAPRDALVGFYVDTLLGSEQAAEGVLAERYSGDLQHFATLLIRG